MHENDCDGCQRDREEEVATQFCLIRKDKLCNLRAKYHRRILLTKDHKVLSLDDLRTYHIAIERKISCFTHAEEIIVYYCQNHSVPCRRVCISTGHRKCDSIETFEEAAEGL